MVSVSFLILRRKNPEMPRLYQVPAYKFLGTMAVLMSGFMVLMYCIPGSGRKSGESGVGNDRRMVPARDSILHYM